MEYRFDKKVHFRQLLLFVFNRDGKNAIAAKAARETLLPRYGKAC